MLWLTRLIYEAGALDVDELWKVRSFSKSLARVYLSNSIYLS